MQDVDAQRRKKVSHGVSSQGLTRLGSAPRIHIQQTDTQDSLMTTSKGPTVMEVQILKESLSAWLLSSAVSPNLKALASPPLPGESCVGFFAWPHKG